MTYWNYRVLKKINPQTNESYFEVCEVYYDENEAPVSWTEDKHLLSYEDLKDVEEAYIEIRYAFEKPILEVVGDKLKEI